MTSGDGRGDGGQDVDPQRLVGDVQAGPGGAMTDEVGVVTGELTVAADLLADGHVAVAVQYTGADEWYTLTGSPVPLPPEGLAAVLDEVLERVRRGGGAEAPR